MEQIKKIDTSTGKIKSQECLVRKLRLKFQMWKNYEKGKVEWFNNDEVRRIDTIRAANKITS